MMTPPVSRARSPVLSRQKMASISTWVSFMMMVLALIKNNSSSMMVVQVEGFGLSSSSSSSSSATQKHEKLGTLSSSSVGKNNNNNDTRNNNNQTKSNYDDLLHSAAVAIWTFVVLGGTLVFVSIGCGFSSSSSSSRNTSKRQQQQRQQQQYEPSRSEQVEDDNANGSSNDIGCSIPWAPGGVPILGHALLYRKDPCGFLTRTYDTLQCPIFQVNMAGRRMVLLCNIPGHTNDDDDNNNNNSTNNVQKQVADRPESILSARYAVADLGFEQTLGKNNVHTGTNIHKAIVRGMFPTNNNNNNSKNNSKSGGVSTTVADRHVTVWLNALRTSLRTEIADVMDGQPPSLPSSSSSGPSYDFFCTIRKVMLRTTVDVMVGKAFLRDDWVDKYDFLQDFMSFQDTLEDVTAKAVILPKWLALTTMLWPLQRRRLLMQKKIEDRLRTMLQQTQQQQQPQQQHLVQSDDDDDDDNDGSNSNDDIGFWLREVLESSRSSGGGGDDNKQGKDDRSLLLSEIAEYIVGLLFAAHKNPAIGAAQSYIMLHEHGSPTVIEKCRTESNNFLVTNPTWGCFQSSCPTLRSVCNETLRLTAHAIGAVRLAQEDVTITVPIVERSSTSSTRHHHRQYTIPRGSTIGLTHITTSLDKSIWGDSASEFHINGDDDDDVRKSELYQDEYKFTVFSHGVHKCPGQQLALLMIQSTVALLLTEYEVTLPKRLPRTSFERATLAQRDGPVLVSIKWMKNTS